MPMLLTVGQIATRAGLTPDTIRYYERLGLIPKPARTAAGYRQYSEMVLVRIGLVRNAQRFGFSLREIAGFLRVRDGGGKPCHDVRARAQDLLEAADRQIAELTAARRQMRATLQEWDARLAQTPVNAPARLLEAPSPVKAVPAGFQPKLRDPDAPRRARAYVTALGGSGNIVRVDACAETRLRLVVRDGRMVQERALQTEGVAALVSVDSQTLHLLVGLNADQYAAEMRGLLAAGA